MTTFDFTAELAAASTENKAPGPITVVLDEAEALAAFATEHWEREPATAGVPGRPGLGSAKERLTETIAPELVALVAEGRRLRRVAMFAKPDLTGEADVARAEFIIDEVESSLEWLFDDGVQDEKDDALDTVRTEHEDAGDTLPEVATRLEDWLELGTPYIAKIDGVGDFDAKLFEEGAALVTKLRAMPEQSSTSARSEAIALRNRYLNLIAERVARVRSSARHVFRAYPDIARLATSAHGRRKRAESRRLAAKKKKAQALAASTATPVVAVATATPAGTVDGKPKA